MRKLMRACAGAVLLSIAAGCASLPYVGHDEAQIPAGWVSYGIDNRWMTCDPWELARTLREHGLTGTSVEFVGWHADARYIDNPDALREPWADFLRAMRAYKLTVLVSIVNDNMGSRKWNGPGIPLSSRLPQARRAREIVMEHGPDLLLIQPVAETQTSAGRTFERETLALCAAQGFRTCYNGGSRPAGAAGATVAAWHPTTLGDLGKPGQLVVSDCGSILAALNSGDVFGNGNPVAVQDYARRVLALRDRGFGYYGFGHSEIDKATIEAIGRALDAAR